MSKMGECNFVASPQILELDEDCAGDQGYSDRSLALLLNATAEVTCGKSVLL